MRDLKLARIGTLLKTSLATLTPRSVLIFIMAVVGALESYTLDKNRKSIRNLLDLAPQTATVRSARD